MKKSILALVGVVALSAVAFAQNSGTQTTAKDCTGTPTCSVMGQTLLQAVKVEGITLTVPNEIDFTLVDGKLNQGNQPLTATVTWDLSQASGTYTNIDCDAWFDTAAAMTATDGSGQIIPSTAIVGQIGGNGPQLHFGDAAPYNTSLTAFDSAFPIFSVPTTTNQSASGTGGSYSANVNLFIDSITDQYPALGPGAVYAGVVYVTAAAI
ncbi:MAG: hypothetical protein FWD64_13090 [Acidobacteriaceae bacterium]|nr:hypothetical protein [Acidobacteriaceae bacterium]